MIISLNGLDACGKTTQIRNIARQYGNMITPYAPVKLSGKIEKMSPKLFHDWWFNSSKCEEFCDEIYSSIQRAFSNLSSDSLLDKGIATFDARVWATLVIKGLSKKHAYEMLQQKKQQYGIRLIEDERILLVNDSKITIEMRKSKYTHEQTIQYMRYQELQREFLDWLYSIGYFTHRISTNCSIEETTRKIIESISWKSRSFAGCTTRVSLEDLQLPNRETEQIGYTLDYVKTVFGSDLIALLIGGSISRKQYIENWSDIDLLLLVKRYNFEKCVELDRFLRQLDIKTGCTIFSEYEVRNELIDAKSLYSIYSYSSGQINSLLYGKIPLDFAVSFELIKQKSKMVISESIHKLKRLLYVDTTEKNQKEIFKLTVLIMKVFLMNKFNIIPQSYKNVMELFNYFTNVITLDSDSVTINNNFSNVIDFSKYVIEYICNEK